MKRLFITVIIALFPVLAGTGDLWAAGERLRTEEMRSEEVTGVVDLILYGARHGDDIETVAILGLTGNGYAFKPYAPEFDYRVEKNVAAEEALKRAKKFAGWHPHKMRLLLSRILDPGGKVIGYEVRPLYDPLVFGVPDVLDVYYRLKDGSVRVTIKTKPEVEMRRRSTGGSIDGRE